MLQHVLLNILRTGCPIAVASFPKPEWVQDHTEEGLKLAHIKMKDFVVGQCWEACCQVVGEAERSTLMAELYKFNFCHLSGTVNSGSKGLAGFAKWLSRESVGSQSQT